MIPADLFSFCLSFIFPADYPFRVEESKSDQEACDHPGYVRRNIYVRCQERHDDTDDQNRQNDLL